MSFVCQQCVVVGHWLTGMPDARATGVNTRLQRCRARRTTGVPGVSYPIKNSRHEIYASGGGLLMAATLVYETDAVTIC